MVFDYSIIELGGDCMLKTQTQLKLSRHSELYDILVTPDNELRQINELVDFSFILGLLEKLITVHVKILSLHQGRA